MIDSHAHLGDPSFDEDREEVFARAKGAGLTHIINICTDKETLEKSLTFPSWILNTAATYLHMSGGLFNVPIVIRMATVWKSCVSGETPILTKNGYIPIKTLKNEKVEVWNGEEWSLVTVRKTGTNQDLIKVTFSNGTSLECTPYHKFYVQGAAGGQIELNAKDLPKGAKLIQWKLPRYVEGDDKSVHYFGMGEIPVGKSVKERVKWLGNFLDQMQQSKYLLQDAFASVEGVTIRGCAMDFCQELRLFLQTLGVDSVIYHAPDSLPSTELTIYCKEIDHLVSLGLTSKHLYLKRDSAFASPIPDVEVVEISKVPDVSDTYCFTEPKRHMGVFNGMLTGQCTEILEYTDKDNIASCNLASIALNSCVMSNSREDWEFKTGHIRITQEDRERMLKQIQQDIPKILLKNSLINIQESKDVIFAHPDNVRYLYTEARKTPPMWWMLRYGEWTNSQDLHFNFSKLERLTAALVRNLEQVIDRNYYPPDVPEIEPCNKRNRPIGIGVQGLADVFALLDLEWESHEARQLNHDIFETMYYAAIKESIRLAKKKGPYETFQGSPASRGLFQFDLWDLERKEKELQRKAAKNPEIDVQILQTEPLRSPDSRYDWDLRRKEMMEYGLRHSLLIALMPTASSASILGNNECFECFTDMMFSRTLLSGQFTVINKHMVKDLQEIGLWTPETCDKIYDSIVKNNGSIRSLTSTSDVPEISERLAFLKRKYKTAFEMPQKVLLQMALDRGRFVCQSQSFNCWMQNPTFKRLNAFLFYSWEQGAKTGMYYLRQKAKFNPIDFTGSGRTQKTVCDDEVCLSCQS